MDDISSQYRVRTAPYYRAVGHEIEQFQAAYDARLPMMLKGPTGCGKSRFVEFMAHRLGRPLVTVACNEDMTAADLVGRFLLDRDGTRWQDGPLTAAARMGAICYLDEVVEARQDTTVVIHPLTDHRRVLPLDKKGELVMAHPDFQLVISYNPGYQSLMKDLKPSTKQRFGALDFTYPDAGNRGRDRRPRDRDRTEAGGKTGADRFALAQPQGPRAGRGHFHPPADLCRGADRQGRAGAGRLQHRHGAAADRRSRHARRARRGRRRLLPVTEAAMDPELAATRQSLAEVSPQIAEVLDAVLHEAARNLSPAGLRNYLEGARGLSELGRGPGPVLAFLEAMPALAREIGEDQVKDCALAAMKLASVTSGEVIAMFLSTAPNAARRLGDADLFAAYVQFLHQLSAKGRHGA